MKKEFKVFTLLIVLLCAVGVVYGTDIRDDMTFTGRVTMSNVTNATATEQTVTNLTVTNATATAISVSGLIKPATAGGISIGTRALPFSGTYIGSAGDKNAHITGTFTGNRTHTAPDADITYSGMSGIDCGTDTACDAVAIATNGKLVLGHVDLASGSAVIAGISPAFTSTVTYSCTVTAQGTSRNLLNCAHTSASSITITSASASDTSTINYLLIGH